MPTKKESAHDDLVQKTRGLTAQEIFHAAIEKAREELKLSARTLEHFSHCNATQSLAG